MKVTIFGTLVATSGA